MVFFERRGIMKRILYFFSIICVLLLSYDLQVSSQARENYGEPIVIYEGDIGLSIISFSQNWSTREQLKEVYEELLKNRHGAEIRYLSNIYIYPDSPYKFDSFYYSNYEKNNENEYVYENSYIELFNADKLSDIQDIARMLSHEYGHHFSFYYLITNEQLTRDDFINSKYADIRNLKSLQQVTYYNNKNKIYSHEWDIAEIIAEDYVQLFGSPLARMSQNYYDVQERVDNNIHTYFYYYNKYNLLPQENLSLPLAADVEGLYDYFINLSGLKVINKPEELHIPIPQLTNIIEINNHYNQYIFQWDKIKTKSILEYTLVYYDKTNNNYPIPIKTIKSNEKMIARAGSAINRKNNLGIFENLEGDYVFQLFVKDGNGFIHGSEPTLINITPKDNSTIKFLDVPNKLWAIDYIYSMTNKGIVVGYPDSTFKPNNRISRGEFLAFLVRTVNNFQSTDPKATHWFIKNGYYKAAVELGLLENKKYSSSYFEKSIKREEMALLIYKMLVYSDKIILMDQDMNFIDQGVISFPKEINLIANYDIILGYPDKSFRPNNYATRAEAIKMIAKYLDIVNG